MKRTLGRLLTRSFSCACIAAFVGSAASSPTFAEQRAEAVAIVGATVHTMTAAGTIENATVVLDGGRIAAVGVGAAIPPNARRIEARGLVVTPGLIDSLSRIGLVEVGAVDGSADTTSDDDRFHAALSVADALNPRSSLVAVNRVEGLTTAVVFPQAGEKSLIAGQAVAVELGDEQLRLVASPAAMFVVLGEAGAERAGGSRAAAMLHLREALAEARDFAAHRAAWNEGRHRSYELSRLDLEALAPVVRGELPLVVWAHRASDLEAALAFVRDGREPAVRLILAGATEAWKIADAIAAAKVPVLFDPLDNLPTSFEQLGARLDQAALLEKAGVRFAFASGDAHNARNLRQAAGNAVAEGLPWTRALAAITSDAAKIWGLDARLGTIAVGQDATLAVWDGDPLEITTYPKQVFVRGVEMPKRTRQNDLLDRYRTLAHPSRTIEER